MQRTQLSALVLSLICLSAAHAADSDIVARLGNTSLSLGEVKQITADAPDLSKVNPQELDHLIRTEVVRKELAAEARQKGLDKSPAVVAQMNRAAEQALVVAYMNGLAKPPADYPSQDEIKQAYDANKSAFVAPAQYRLAQIFVAGTDDKAAARADETYKQASAKDADFAQLARTLSQHKPSAEQGGDMGWITENNVVPAIRTALAGLSAGSVAKPVAAEDGYHIVKLLDQKASRQLTLDEVKAYLAQSLRMQRAKQTEAKYLDDLMAKTPIEINGIALGQLSRGN